LSTGYGAVLVGWMHEDGEVTRGWNSLVFSGWLVDSDGAVHCLLYLIRGLARTPRRPQWWVEVWKPSTAVGACSLTTTSLPRANQVNVLLCSVYLFVRNVATVGNVCLEKDFTYLTSCYLAVMLFADLGYFVSRSAAFKSDLRGERRQTTSAGVSTFML